MTTPRLCACDCGQRLDDRRANVRYVDRTHQQRAYRAKVRAEAEALGIPGSLSFKTVRAQGRTANRHVDGPRRDTGARRARKRARRTPDLRVNHRKAIVAVATVLAGHPLYVPRTLALRLAGEALEAALTERQRAALREREERA